MAGTEKPMRILVMVNFPWDPRLGAVRVYVELSEQWRALGHTVEKYSLSDAFPNDSVSSARFRLRQLLFAYKAANFVRKNSGRFDVIDALIGVLPFSKKRLGFKGLLVSRSVGLDWLYEQFDRSVRRRWARAPKGKLVGRIFYALTRRHLLRASNKAVCHADLINVPNEEEATSLGESGRSIRAVVVQPYGLTEEQRQSLFEAAAPALTRLNERTVCFVGMWSARKGAHDWSGIIRRIQVQLPKVRFRFLGTMVDSRTIMADLQLESFEGIEFISDYSPNDLPQLLGRCAVGAFPSYAEGFGLAVLEQLAAGIPTVAYNTAGPRDILARNLPELLVAKGDPEGLAAAILRILQLDPAKYQSLSARCVDSVARFSWPSIAKATLNAYHDAQKKNDARPVFFVQPFSLGSAGGGPRILRALLEGAPFVWRSVCTSPQTPRPWPNEIHLQSRPLWGRIEYTRFASIPNLTARFFAPVFRRRLKNLCLQERARAFHIVPHSSLEFAQVQDIARELELPFFVSLHDDLAYTAARGGAPEATREAAMRAAWCGATGRFVISDALGQEYCSRYGARGYQVVTDGVSELTPFRPEAALKELRVYFMGLFHVGYEPNLRALLKGLANLKRAEASLNVQMTCRCEHIRPEVLDGFESVIVLPFASEAQIKADMTTADLLYMPMPFGPAHEKFARYSLSTKMVTYVSSGVPILYHGPAKSAAFDLLKRNDAAVLMTTLEPEEIAETLSSLTARRRGEIASNALALAERQFMLVDQTKRFWGEFTQAFSSG